MDELPPVGAIGKVVRTVRGGRIPGEVRVVVAGEAKLFLAYADEEIPVDGRVRVRRGRGPRQVEVEPWPRRTS